MPGLLRRVGRKLSGSGRCQRPAGNTNHELWLYSDIGCATNVKADNTAYFVWTQYTQAGEILPLRIEPALYVRCVIIRTISDPSSVAWEEVQIFQELAPPSGFPESTPTISPTGSPSKTPTPTSTA